MPSQTSAAKLEQRLIELAQEPVHDLAWRWRTGECYDAWYRGNGLDFSKTGQHGLIARLVERLGGGEMNRTLLLYYRRLFHAYRLKEIDRLIKSRLNWSHIKYLLDVRDPKERRQLEKRVTDEGLSCSSLLKVIQSRHGVRSAGHGKRKELTSISPDADLRELANRIKRFAEDIWALQDSAIRAVPKSQRAEVQKTLANLIGKTRQLSQKLARVVEPTVDNP